MVVRYSCGEVSIREREIQPKINLSQIAGEKIGVLNIFRFSFEINWPLKTPKYTSLIVYFSEKLKFIVLKDYFRLPGLKFLKNGIFGISGCFM